MFEITEVENWKPKNTVERFFFIYIKILNTAYTRFYIENKQLSNEKLLRV